MTPMIVEVGEEENGRYDEQVDEGRHRKESVEAATGLVRAGSQAENKAASSLFWLVAAHELPAPVPEPFPKAGADELKFLLQDRSLVRPQLLEQHGQVGRDLGHRVRRRRKGSRGVLACAL